MSLAVMGVFLMSAMGLPEGPTPEALEFRHFPDRLHCFVWRNWSLVPVERMAEVVGATPEQIVELGRAMGLDGPPPVPREQQDRSYITVIRRNWHLLPFDQLMGLLGRSEEELSYILREDDFLWIKLGSLKPRCEPLKYAPPTEEVRRQEAEISALVREYFPDGVAVTDEPLFAFVEELSRPPRDTARPSARKNRFSPRYCYSYFATYGDPLLDTRLDPFPDGLLERMSAAGANGVWLQGVLYKLAPFPWDESLSESYRERLRNLRALVERAKQRGVGIFLYLNEPRAMPLSFFDNRPELKGVTESGFASLCSEAPEVKDYLRRSVSLIAKEVPELAGFFTITASENLTNCWSHYGGAQCPRCASVPPWQAIANVNRTIQEGIDEAGTGAQLIAWDWGWKDEWAGDVIRALPQKTAHMSVSEWSLPIERGGVKSEIGEYSISAIGPGPRASRHWQLARERGLKTLAKVQAGNTWELSSVPYIPAIENVARHAANLRDSGVEGLMLGWTLGGYPSPNLEVFAEIGSDAAVTPEEAMLRTATRRFGADSAPAVVKAWQTMSRAFQEFPYSGGTVYQAPLQAGPSNLLWGEPTGYQATMVGFAYDDADAWRAIYSAETFMAQLRKCGQGFQAGAEELKKVAGSEYAALAAEIRVAEACAITYFSVANQTDFVGVRDGVSASQGGEKATLQARARTILEDEIELAKRMHAIQGRDSRIGFEASNQYQYVPADLAEKVLNCRFLLERGID